MRQSRRPVTVLRVGATLLMLAWLSRHAHLSQLRLPAVHPATLAWLGAALAASLAGIVLSTLRWQRALQALDLPSPVRSLLPHQLAGAFVGNFLPTTIGGDVVRTTRLAATNGDTPATVASIVLERLTGWLVLPVLTLLALAVNPELLRVAPAASGTALWVALGTLALLVVVLALATSPRIGRRLGGTDGWRRFAGAVHLGLDRARHRPGLAFEILTAGFAYQLAVVLAAFLAAKTLGIAVGWTALLAFFPVVAIVQVLPVTIGGLGTREAALAFFLAPLGVQQADAVALGLLMYLVTLGVSLLGAPAFAVGTRQARVTA